MTASARSSDYSGGRRASEDGRVGRSAKGCREAEGDRRTGLDFGAHGQDRATVVRVNHDLWFFGVEDPPPAGVVMVAARIRSADADLGGHRRF